MTGDASLPSLLGYVAALLYNPNNISSEASPVTTRLELEVGNDIARMIGYRPQTHWTHLTSGGTVANAEALWVTRSLKYLPVAIRWAAEELGVDRLAVELPTGWHVPIQEAQLWQLLNLSAGATLDVADRLAHQVGAAAAARAVAKWSPGSMGDQAFGRRLSETFSSVLEPAVLLVPGTAHYSWDKVARMTGVGSAQIVRVPVDECFRMSVTELRRIIELLTSLQRPILGCVAVIGSTEEGAVDPLHEIAELREDLAQRHRVSFHLHADAAFGGYAAAATWRADGTRAQPTERAWPTAHVSRSLQALARADSVTIDPHKLGFAPYPAGAVSFRDGRAKVLCASDAPYVFHGEGSEHFALGRFTFEGSRPGAAAAALALSHRVLPLHQQGHGALISSCVTAAKRLRRILTKGAWAPFKLVLLPESDLNLVCFTFRHPLLRTLEQLNAFVDRLHAAHSSPAPRQARYFVSRTVLRTGEYGAALGPVARELGFGLDDCERAGGIHVLRCTVMHPSSVATEALLRRFATHLAKSLEETLNAPELIARAS